MLSTSLPSDEDDEAVILRAVVALAIIVLRPVQAWAEGGGSVPDAGSLLRDGGPWGAVTLLVGVIGILWLQIKSQAATIAALQEKRATENAEWAGKFATTAATAANEIRQTAEKLEDQGRLLQAVTETAKGWPQAIQSILASLDRNGERMMNLPESLRAIIQQSRGT